jgi:hypothetical protein
LFLFLRQTAISKFLLGIASSTAAAIGSGTLHNSDASGYNCRLFHLHFSGGGGGGGGIRSWLTPLAEMEEEE